MRFTKERVLISCFGRLGRKTKEMNSENICLLTTIVISSIVLTIDFCVINRFLSVLNNIK